MSKFDDKWRHFLTEKKKALNEMPRAWKKKGLAGPYRDPKTQEPTDLEGILANYVEPDGVEPENFIHFSGFEAAEDIEPVKAPKGLPFERTKKFRPGYGTLTDPSIGPWQSVPAEERGSRQQPTQFKFGIKPTSGYNTPLGIYAYPLNNKIYADLFAGAIPYASDRPYVLLFKTEPGATILYTSQDIPQDELNDYLKTLFTVIAPKEAAHLKRKKKEDPKLWRKAEHGVDWYEKHVKPSIDKALEGEWINPGLWHSGPPRPVLNRRYAMAQQIKKAVAPTFTDTVIPKLESTDIAETYDIPGKRLTTGELQRFWDRMWDREGWHNALKLQKLLTHGEQAGDIQNVDWEAQSTVMGLVAGYLGDLLRLKLSLMFAWPPYTGLDESAYEEDSYTLSQRWGVGGFAENTYPFDVLTRLLDIWERIFNYHIWPPIQDEAVKLIRNKEFKKEFFEAPEDDKDVDWLGLGEVAQSISEWDFYIKESNGVTTNIGALWAVTRRLAGGEGSDQNADPRRWSLIFRQLGIAGIVDDAATKTIHTSEPLQAVFFTTHEGPEKVISLIDVFPNTQTPNKRQRRKQWMHQKDFNKREVEAFVRYLGRPPTTQERSNLRSRLTIHPLPTQEGGGWAAFGGWDFAVKKLKEGGDMLIRQAAATALYSNTIDLVNRIGNTEKSKIWGSDTPWKANLHDGRGGGWLLRKDHPDFYKKLQETWDWVKLKRSVAIDAVRAWSPAQVTWLTNTPKESVFEDLTMDEVYENFKEAMEFNTETMHQAEKSAMDILQDAWKKEEERPRSEPTGMTLEELIRKLERAGRPDKVLELEKYNSALAKAISIGEKGWENEMYAELMDARERATKYVDKLEKAGELDESKQKAKALNYLDNKWDWVVD